MAKSCKALGLRILDWHDGGGSTLYAAGSSLFAGRKIPRDLARRAADQLESHAFVPAAERKRNGWTAKDVRSLLQMVRQLRGGSCT